ncbi:hypothetical protein JCM3770_002540 [Rhodotorula araucariae]
MTATSGPFTARAVTAGSTRDAQKQAVFAQFKAVCVPLLEAARTPSSAHAASTAARLLAQLEQQLRCTPPSAFTPALANYAFFPLSSLLRPPLDGQDRGDRVLEATMQALAALVDKWRVVGMEPRVRQELWIMTALTLGGPLDPSGPGKAGAAATKGKGKAVVRTEESKLAMVEVLLALMRPPDGDERKADDDDEDPLGERIDWSCVDVTDPSTLDNGGPQRPRDSPPPVPILFHTLTTLLALSAEPTSLLQLQLSSLEALRILVADYLAHPAPSATVPASAGPSPLLATALPGTASTLSRIALSMPSSSKTEYGKSTRRQASSVIIAALQTLSLLIVETVGDAVTSKLREGQNGVSEANVPAATLEELVEGKLDELALSQVDNEGAEHAPLPPDDPAPSPPAAGPAIPTPAWLRFTIASLSTLFAALSPLSTHDSPLVRRALATFLSHILTRCAHTLGEQAEILLEGLLALASDSWDDVRLPAQGTLLAAFALPTNGSHTVEGPHPLALAARIVQRRLAALPGALRRQDEHAVRRGAGIIRAALELLPRVGAGVGSTSSPLHGVDRWSWALLAALEVERVPAAGRRVEGGMTLAWITGAADAPSTSESATGATAYPPVRLRAISEAATVHALEALWEALGRASAAADQAGEVVDQFLGVALGPRRDQPAAASTLWVLDGVLRGMSGDVQLPNAQKKVLKRAVRAVLALMEDLEEASAEDEPVPAGNAVDEPRRDLLGVEDDEASAAIRLIEHKRGVTTMPSLEAYNPVAALTTTRDTRASHLVLLSSFSLRILATSASLLSTAFQPFLMQSLYHVLAHLSPTTHAFLRAHAQHALALISTATAYASPQNLVLANVDYVVNSVSQRLSGAHLEPNAPLVLVEMIRLVGRPIVPMVQDLVDDVFEALDDYHGYDEVTVGLWAVLDALLKVMVEDLPPPPQAAADDGRGITAATKDVPQPNADADWQEFEDWLAHRHDPPACADDSAVPDDLPPSNPQQPFSSLHAESPEAPPAAGGPNGDARADDPDPSFASDTVAPAPPTRAQRVTVQIVSKALFFLSHPSAFLRARVLSLMASSVPLLLLPAPAVGGGGGGGGGGQTREADLLPVVHRAWPAILARLAPPPREEAPVSRAAAALVGALATHAGAFVARRMAEDVWPRLVALLPASSPSPSPSASASASSGRAAGGGARGAGIEGRFSAEHRQLVDVLDALGAVATGVPLRETQLWDGALALRALLVRGGGIDDEIRRGAARVVEALARQNPDAVWCVLRGTVGGAGAGADDAFGLPRWLARGWETVEWGDEMQRLLEEL